ncbi:hypothetical protein LEP1GSC088_3581 [Leptospira interrogans str. L1207]|nr:hypothetical protein LEP1GSC088_3581 [Leptospira interrogans str. L1207]
MSIPDESSSIVADISSVDAAVACAPAAKELEEVVNFSENVA